VTPSCVVYAGDATQLRFEVIDWSRVAAQICDPPYSEHVHAAATSHHVVDGSAVGKGVRKRDLGFASIESEAGLLLRATIARSAASVARWSLIYSDIESTHLWRAACVGMGAIYIRTIPWIRWSMPQLSGDRPPQGCEMVSVFYGAGKGRKHWNGPGNLTHLDHKCLRGENKHKTEKPLDQMLDLVEWFSDPGELVIDLTAGSGTTGVACALLGRHFVGFELDTAWAERAQQRIAAALLGPDHLSKRDQERLSRYLDRKEKHEQTQDQKQDRQEVAQGPEAAAQ